MPSTAMNGSVDSIESDWFVFAWSIASASDCRGCDRNGEDDQDRVFLGYKCGLDLSVYRHSKQVYKSSMTDFRWISPPNDRKKPQALTPKKKFRLDKKEVASQR